MLNIIRADLYRIVRGKGLYITFAVLFFLIALTLIDGVAGTVGIQMEGLEESLGGNTVAVFDGMTMAEVQYKSMDNTIWFLLPLFIFVAAPMFSYGTVKNEISCGVSRVTLYLSKLLLSSLFCVLVMVVYMVGGILIVTVMKGFGGTPPEGYWLHIIQICASQLFIMLALNAVGIFLVFTTKRTAMVNGIYIAFCLIPPIIILVFSGMNPDFLKLYDYDLTGIIKQFAYIDALSAAEIVKGFAIGAGYMALSIVGGIALFKKAEIS